MKWQEFKTMVDKHLKEQVIEGHAPHDNPRILYIDFNENIEPSDIQDTRMGLIITSDE